MSIDKAEYTQIVEKWLNNYLEDHYSSTHDIKIIVSQSNISKIEDSEVKKHPAYSLSDFSPDLLGVLTSKETREVSFVLLNRNISATSIKKIGEMNLYSQMLNPEISFIVSLKGLPNEVNNLMLNDNVCSSLLSYGDKEIVLLKINDDGCVDSKATFPRKLKNKF